jgi:hypothetical protein
VVVGAGRDSQEAKAAVTKHPAQALVRNTPGQDGPHRADQCHGTTDVPGKEHSMSHEERIAALEAENAELRATLAAMAQRLADKAHRVEPESVYVPIRNTTSDVAALLQRKEWVTL